LCLFPCGLRAHSLARVLCSKPILKTRQTRERLLSPFLTAGRLVKSLRRPPSTRVLPKRTTPDSNLRSMRSLNLLASGGYPDASPVTPSTRLASGELPMASPVQDDVATSFKRRQERRARADQVWAQERPSSQVSDPPGSSPIVVTLTLVLRCRQCGNIHRLLQASLQHVDRQSRRAFKELWA